MFLPHKMNSHGQQFRMFLHIFSLAFKKGNDKWDTKVSKNEIFFFFLVYQVLKDKQSMK